MDFALTEEQRLAQQTARDFARTHVAPLAAEIDRAHRHPGELVAQLGDLGFMGVAVPEGDGGAGLDAVTYVLALEEVAHACASTGTMPTWRSRVTAPPTSRPGCSPMRADWSPVSSTTASRHGAIPDWTLEEAVYL